MVAPTAIAGQITRLAETTAEGTLARQVPIYTNVKLLLAPVGEPQHPDVYAKVVGLTPADAGAVQVRLEFTSVPEGAKAFLSRMGQGAPTA